MAEFLLGNERVTVSLKDPSEPITEDTKFEVVANNNDRWPVYGRTLKEEYKPVSTSAQDIVDKI